MAKVIKMNDLGRSLGSQEDRQLGQVNTLNGYQGDPSFACQLEA